jgi:hypothetical protein
MDIKDIKKTLTRIKGAPLGTIPKSELEALSHRILSVPGRMRELCFGLFPDGRTSAKGDYWEVPEVWVHQQRGLKPKFYKYALRMSFKTGACFDWNTPNREIIRGSNPLFLAMIVDKVLLREKNGLWQCTSGKDLKRCVDLLNAWCDSEDGRADERAERDLNRPGEVKQLVYVLLSSEKIKRKSAKQIWNLLDQNSGGDIRDVRELASHYLLFDLLKEWAEPKRTLGTIGVSGFRKMEETPELVSVSTEGSRKKVYKFSLSFNA